MGLQRGAQLGINIAALDMVPASTRSQATSKVLTALGISAAKHRLWCLGVGFQAAEHAFLLLA